MAGFASGSPGGRPAGPRARRDRERLPGRDRDVLVAALATLVAAQLFDFATFVLMVRADGPHAEANPLVAHLFDHLGSPALLLAKLLLILGVAGLSLAGVARRGQPGWRFLAAVPLALAIAAGLLGGISNARVIIMA